VTSNLRLLVPAISLVLAATASAGTRYVNVNLATGNNDGTTWADAYRTADGVAVALTAAISGDEIWVAAGTYKATTTTTRTIYHTLKNGVAVYGGFSGVETAVAQRNVALNVTTLTGDLNGDDGSSLFGDNSFHVVQASSTASTAILDGFTVTGGNANSTANQDRGGGILMVTGGNATVRNCIFRANRCTFGGGAGYINASSPTFTDCRFENNVGGSFGGAFDQATNVGTVFTRCVFSGNSAARAGAIEIFSSSPVKVYDCLFFNNTATGSGSGGAVFVSGSNPSFRNCTIFGNNATTSAGAGMISSGGTVEVANCIVYGNTGAGGAQAATNQLNGSTYNVTYSCVQGGFAGTGNISSNPSLLNTAGGDYRLTIASPCIDAGNNATLPPSVPTDLDGRPRQFDEPTVADTGSGIAPIVDMGAYEFPAPTMMAYCAGDGFSTPCPCGNSSTLFGDEGCLSSIGMGGKLVATGTARYGADTLVLSGTQMPNGPCLYFQGTTQLAGGQGVTFGDGLRCVGGTVIRLAIKTNVAGASQFPAGGDPSISTAGLVNTPGSQRNYQIWYRDSASFCSASTFNLTGAIAVTWEL